MAGSLRRTTSRTAETTVRGSAAVRTATVMPLADARVVFDLGRAAPVHVGDDGEAIAVYMLSVMRDESAQTADRLEAAKWLADPSTRVT